MTDQTAKPRTADQKQMTPTSTTSRAGLPPATHRFLSKEQTIIFQQIVGRCHDLNEMMKDLKDTVVEPVVRSLIRDFTAEARGKKIKSPKQRAGTMTKPLEGSGVTKPSSAAQNSAGASAPVMLSAVSTTKKLKRGRQKEAAATADIDPSAAEALLVDAMELVAEPTAEAPKSKKSKAAAATASLDHPRAKRRLVFESIESEGDAKTAVAITTTTTTTAASATPANDDQETNAATVQSQTGALGAATTPIDTT